MKKIIFFVFALACITTISYGQDSKEIKPFTPNAADAAKIKSILAGMSKEAYSIEVKQNKKSAAYGSLNKARVSSGVAVGSKIGSSASSWAESLLTKLIKSTKSIDKEAVVQLQAIAAKY